MKKTFAVSCWLFLAFFLSVQLCYAERKPEMKCSVSYFIKNYNQKADELMLPKLSEKDVRHQSGEMETNQIFLTKFSVVTMVTNPGGKSLTSLMFNGVGDETKLSGSMILASVTNTIMAVEPFFSSGEINAIMNGLGFFGGIEDGKPRSVSMRGFKFSSILNPTLGLMVGVDPAE